MDADLNNTNTKKSCRFCRPPFFLLETSSTTIPPLLLTFGIKDSARVLEPYHQYYTRRQKNLGAMDPNFKPIFEEAMKMMRVEITKEISKCFADHDAVVNQRFADFAAAAEHNNARVTSLEEAASKFDHTFSNWQPEIEASVADIRLEISKLNKFFDRDAREHSGFQLGVLGTESTSARPSAGFRVDGPRGHRAEPHYRDDGPGFHNTQTHHPVKGSLVQVDPLQFLTAQLLHSSSGRPWSQIRNTYDTTTALIH
ncbi:uncharacterized protein [Zea mays]|uniref:uncharacterized protein n=1 Tax=Zea mays TaxID=4577 RepID=UPI0004DE873D|nr:uncharacterized protein LOC103644420 [Zea mays]